MNEKHSCDPLRNSASLLQASKEFVPLKEVIEQAPQISSSRERLEIVCDALEYQSDIILKLRGRLGDALSQNNEAKEENISPKPADCHLHARIEQLHAMAEANNQLLNKLLTDIIL